MAYQSVFHYSANKMREFFGQSFPELAKRWSGSTPAQMVAETFLNPVSHAIKQTDNAILEASLNPVAPCHVLAFPAPEILGMKKHNGEWIDLPADGGFIHVSEKAVLETMASLYDWTVCDYKNVPELQKSNGNVRQSFWTANLGKAAFLAVPLLHVHHLMVFEDSFYNSFKSIDNEVERFIRFSKEKPESLLRHAFIEKHGVSVVTQLERDTRFIPIENLPVGPDEISISRPRGVKTNDFTVDFNKASGNITKDDIKSMIQLAYAAQTALSAQGAAGFTMVADTTVLQCPKNGETSLSMYFVTHMQGDPEWLRGGFVYTAQKYTAPSMANLNL